MKDSKEYTKKIQKLHRTLKRKYPKVEPVFFEEPADAIVYGIVSEHLKEKATQTAMKRFAEYFVDLNDLRVARTEEIVEVLGEDSQASRTAALTLCQVLGGIFNKHHRMSLESLKKAGKRPARAAIEKMPGISLYVIDFCMLTAFQGHAIPLNTAMLEYLKANDLVHPEATELEIEGFLSKQISAKNGYEFFLLLRHESELLVKTRKTTRKKTKSKETATDAETIVETEIAAEAEAETETETEPKKKTTKKKSATTQKNKNKTTTKATPKTTKKVKKKTTKQKK